MTNSAQKIEQEISTIVNGNFMDDLSDEGVKLMVNRLDPKAVITFQPPLLETEKGEWLVNFSDGSTFKFDQYDNQ